MQFVRLGLIHIALSLMLELSVLPLFITFPSPIYVAVVQGWQAFLIKGQVANTLGSGVSSGLCFIFLLSSCFGSVFRVLAPFNSMKTILSSRARQTNTLLWKFIHSNSWEHPPIGGLWRSVLPYQQTRGDYLVSCSDPLYCSKPLNSVFHQLFMSIPDRHGAAEFTYSRVRIGQEGSTSWVTVQK